MWLSGQAGRQDGWRGLGRRVRWRGYTIGQGWPSGGLPVSVGGRLLVVALCHVVQVVLHVEHLIIQYVPARHNTQRCGEPQPQHTEVSLSTLHSPSAVYGATERFSSMCHNQRVRALTVGASAQSLSPVLPPVACLLGCATSCSHPPKSGTHKGKEREGAQHARGSRKSRPEALD